MPATGLLSLSPRSANYFHWRARDYSLRALTGQLGVFVRPGTSTALDQFSSSFPVGYGQPRWEHCQFNDGVSTTGRRSLRLGTGGGEALYWTIGEGMETRTLTIFCRWMSRTIAAGSGTVWQLGKADNSPPRALLYGPFATQMAGWHDETGTTRQTPIITYAADESIDSRVVLNPDGSVTLGMKRNGAAEVITGPTAALAFTGFWSDARLWAGSLNGGTTGDINLLDLKILLGVNSMQQCYDAF